MHEDERMEKVTKEFKEEQDNVNNNFSETKMEISYNSVEWFR